MGFRQASYSLFRVTVEASFQIVLRPPRRPFPVARVQPSGNPFGDGHVEWIPALLDVLSHLVAFALEEDPDGTFGSRFGNPPLMRLPNVLRITVPACTANVSGSRDGLGKAGFCASGISELNVLAKDLGDPLHEDLLSGCDVLSQLIRGVWWHDLGICVNGRTVGLDFDERDS